MRWFPQPSDVGHWLCSRRCRPDHRRASRIGLQPGWLAAAPSAPSPSGSSGGAGRCHVGRRPPSWKTRRGDVFPETILTRSSAVFSQLKQGKSRGAVGARGAATVLEHLSISSRRPASLSEHRVPPSGISFYGSVLPVHVLPCFRVRLAVGWSQYVAPSHVVHYSLLS